MIELGSPGSLPSWTVGDTITVWNGDRRSSILVSDIACRTGELLAPEGCEIIGDEGLVGFEANEGAIDNGQGIVDGQEATMIEILSSSSKAESRS